MKTSERIKELRTERGMSQSEFAKLLHTSQTCISSYEASDRTPNTEMLMIISEKCDVSIDWLLGLSDIKNQHEEKPSYETIFVWLTKMQSSGYFDIKIEKNDSDKDEDTLLIQANDKKIVTFFKAWEDVRNACTNTQHSKRILDLFKKNYNEFEE